MSARNGGPPATGRYRARVDCRAAGMFRRAGDEFEMPLLRVVPAHLEELDAQAPGPEEAGKRDMAAGQGGGKPAKAPGARKSAAGTGRNGTAKPAPVPGHAQVSKQDIGVGQATPVQDVTSADMVRR